MIDALESVARFVSGRHREELESDEMLAFALARALEIVGEAAARLNEETRTLAPEANWSAIIGMRNRLVHAYARIDPDILWTTAVEAAPELLALVRRLHTDAGL